MPGLGLFQLRHLREVASFGLVGLAASLTHICAAIFLTETAGLAPWLANIPAFFIAVPVSYLGHSYLTFLAHHHGREHAISDTSFRRFLLTASTGFALNQTSVVVFATWLELPARPVFVCTTFGVAWFLFLAGKFWAFSGRKRSREPS